MDTSKLQRQLRPSPRTNRPNRQETFVLVTCPDCGGKRWLREADARKSADGWCNLCQCRHNRLNNPSLYEQQVIALLNEVGLAFEREVRVWLNSEEYFCVDFVVGDLFVEIDGVQHARPRWMKRDAIVLNLLNDRKVVRVSAKELTDDAAGAFRRVLEAL